MDYEAKAREIVADMWNTGRSRVSADWIAAIAAALKAAGDEEREACAKVADRYADAAFELNAAYREAEAIAAAIRSRT